METQSEIVIPQHIAIIMDGNGRWAKSKNKPRIFGHRAGAKTVDKIVSHAREIGVRYLTLYTFSTENWNRPKAEIEMLMGLLVQQLKQMEKKLLKNNIRLRAQGQLDRLSPAVKKELFRVMQSTDCKSPKMELSLALSYGGRQEIINATQSLARKVGQGLIKAEEIDELTFQKELYHPDFPEPDLLIRTGGEYRVSNFLLWEIAYSEIYVTHTHWPEFKENEFSKAIEAFNSRNRRFGKTQEQINLDSHQEPPC